MKRVMQFTAALAMAFAMTACAGDDVRDNENATTPGGGAATGTTGTADIDRDFVQDQLAAGEAEVELSRLAQEKATHPDVKEFAAMMVRDHQSAGQDLRQIATQANATANTAENRMESGLQEADRELREELSKLTGSDFDRRYIDEMIDDHQEAVDDLRGKAEDASHPQVKAWASKTLPTIQQHLQRAESIKETLERAGDQR